MEKAFFLDKDGTLTKYVIYSNPAKAREILEDEIIFDKIVDGLKYIQEKGYKLIIVSNQPWVSRGIVNYDDMEKLFKNLVDVFEKKGVKIDDYFYCPHRSIDKCNCRKDDPGMVFRAAEKHNIYLGDSYFVGDREKDVLAGKRAGTKTILVLTGRGKEFKDSVEATHIVEDINSLKEII